MMGMISVLCDSRPGCLPFISARPATAHAGRPACNIATRGCLVLVAAAAARRRHQAGKDAARLRQLACSVRMKHSEASL